MIWGVVNARREAVVTLHLRGPDGAEISVDAVVDSGFSGSLTLPAATVTTLGLTRQSGGSAIFADGSSHSFDIFAAEVEWDGNWRTILVSAVGTETLMGMGLLVGHELRIEVVPGGEVEINSLP